MGRSFGDDLGMGLMSFVQAANQSQKTDMERQALAQQSAMQQARLEDMQYQRQRQDKQDYMQSYDKGMDELTNDALMKMATGQPIDGIDPSILRRVDPTKLFALKQMADDQAWKASMGMGGQPPGLMSPQGQQAPQQAPMTPGGGGEPAVPQGQIKDLIDYWSRYHGANPADVYPVAKVESNYQQTDPKTGKILTSPAGARGVMQLMPGTAQGMGVNPDDVSDNINGGVKYLRQMQDRFGGDMQQAYRAYNGGPGGVNSPATAPYADKVMALRGQPQMGQQMAQAGPQTMTDASGRPPVQGQQVPQYGGQGGDRLSQILKLPPEQFARVVMTAPKDKQSVLVSLYKEANPEAPAAVREFEAVNGRRPNSPEEYRQFKKGESAGGSAFEGTGMEQQSWSIVNAIGPKIQDGTATPDEQRRYMSAEAHLSTPKVSTDPSTGAQTVMQLDLGQFGFPSLRKQAQQTQPPQQGGAGQQTAQTGYTTTQNGGRKPLSANDAGKIQGANLSLDYLNQVESKLFPNGEYDRGAVMKSYLPGAEEGDIRNKVREAIGYALYLKTGAAATPKEIAEQESLYMPGLTDTAGVAKSKVSRLRSFLSSVVQGTGREGSAAGASGSWENPDLKSKYGLE